MYSVILIDDEEIIRKGLRKLVDWEDMGCEIVAEAEDGEQGFELIKEYVPDIIISDIQMPNKNGLQMIADVKDINQNTQIIILTGFREFEYAQEAIKLGVLQFLLKPSKIAEITAAVEEAVSNLRTQEEENEKYNKMKEEVRNYYLKEAINASQDKKIDPVLNKPQYMVNESIKYIKKNYDQKVNLQDIADMLYVSTWHLCKVLKKETGTNFVELLNGVRIEEAKKLLVTTNLRVYEVALEVGYTDTAYFSKIFKRFVGMTANEYRNTQYCTTNSKIDSF